MTANRKPAKQDDPAHSRASVEKSREIEADDKKSTAGQASAHATRLRKDAGQNIAFAGGSAARCCSVAAVRCLTVPTDRGAWPQA